MATAAALDQARREGIADACVLLVARRINVSLTLEDWARHLGVTRTELVAAVDRLKARAEAKRTPPPRTEEARVTRRSCRVHGPRLPDGRPGPSRACCAPEEPRDGRLRPLRSHREPRWHRTAPVPLQRTGGLT